MHASVSQAGGRTVLVTGGAGYIGSHVVKQLVESGETVVVLDNLSNGYRNAVLGAEFYEGDVLDYSLLESILRARNVEAILHFAASTIVSESVENPSKYYRNNTGGTANLLHCAAANNVNQFVFSSTAAVYGIPDAGACLETTPTNPINPYGRSKLFSEEMLREISSATDLRHVILRYFNVAGADMSGQLGQRGKTSTHITKIACEVAAGKRERIEIYGTDYPTPDGTCVRDYIHVDDLAAAHVAALAYLRASGESLTLNCGYGEGFSVIDVIRAVERAAGEKLPQVVADRRPGDPPVLIAKPDRIHEALGWQPQFNDLDTIVGSALRWEQSIMSDGSLRTEHATRGAIP